MLRMWAYMGCDFNISKNNFQIRNTSFADINIYEKFTGHDINYNGRSR